MKHNNKGNHLGRNSSHRKAMLANLANSLIEHKRITTTVPKAKALKMYVEPLITKAKDDTTHSRRVVFSYLKSKTVVSELFRDVAEKVGDRPGGYTRILKTGNRLGDNAPMCIIELVDYNESMLSERGTKVRTTRRGTNKKSKSSYTNSDSDVKVVEEEKKTSQENLDNSDITINTTSNLEYIMAPIKDETPYGLGIEISIHAEESNVLELHREYSMEVEVKIDDPKKRKHILDDFCIALNSEKLNVDGLPIRKVEFGDNAIGVSKFLITPAKVGHEKLEINFLQNSGNVKMLPYHLEIK